ncbi:MAG: (2Fe-2S) ferredoxin domain-containing protein [Thermotaleaceae bacterium]
MKIKSLDELIKIREESFQKIRLREHEETAGDVIEILVGMATCGIAAGAREILNTFMEEIAEKNIAHVKVIPVGCIGSCHSEPIVQVNIPGKKPVFYGNVKKENVYEIIKNHIQGKKPVEKLVLDIDFERVQ